MKKRFSYFIIAFATFGVGILVVFSVHRLENRYRPSPKPPAIVQNESALTVFRVDMLKVIREPKQPINVVSVRLADLSGASSDFLIDVENVSTRKITDVWFYLAPFENCHNAPAAGKPVISNRYPRTLASAPKPFIRPHEKLTLKVPQEIYEAILQSQVKWNCTFTTEVRLRGV